MVRRSSSTAVVFSVAAGIITLLTTCSPEPGGVQELSAEHLEVREMEERLADDSFTIMSWNVKGSNFRSDNDHLKKVAATIREYGPDVVMLQEIHRETTASGEQDQFEILARSLEMNGCFGESLEIGDRGSYGNMILSTGRISDARRYLLPGRGEPRTILACTSHWKDLSVPLMTTHLTAWDRANRRTRTLQTAAIVALLESDGSPLTILGGDFNASLGSSEMAQLAASTIVRPAIETYVVTHRGTGRNYDHLFAGDGWRVDDARVIREGPSDHWPIVATLSTARNREGRE